MVCSFLGDLVDYAHAPPHPPHRPDPARWLPNCPTGADEILWRFGRLIDWDEIFVPGLVENAVMAGGAESENAFGSGGPPVAHARLFAVAFDQELTVACDANPHFSPAMVTRNVSEGGTTTYLCPSI